MLKQESSKTIKPSEGPSSPKESSPHPDHSHGQGKPTKISKHNNKTLRGARPMYHSSLTDHGHLRRSVGVPTPGWHSSQSLHVDGDRTRGWRLRTSPNGSTTFHPEIARQGTPSWHFDPEGLLGVGWGEIQNKPSCFLWRGGVEKQGRLH